ncbi:MAG: transcriptional regulator [Acidobacteriota bacterium]
MASRSTSGRAVRRTAEPDAGSGPARRDVTSRLPDLDRIIHERIRLGIISALAVNDVLSFNDLKALLGTTDGNLSVHARKLEQADYVACTKSFDGRQPRTEFRITATGRRALDRYLHHMDALIQATKQR